MPVSGIKNEKKNQFTYVNGCAFIAIKNYKKVAPEFAPEFAPRVYPGVGPRVGPGVGLVVDPKL